MKGELLGTKVPSILDGSDKMNKHLYCLEISSSETTYY